MKAITSEVINKLEEIGFEEDEINAIQIIHNLKNREYKASLREIINKAAFQSLSDGIAETFEKNQWTDGDFFEVVEKYRDEKRK